MNEKMEDKKENNKMSPCGLRILKFSNENVLKEVKCEQKNYTSRI